MSTYDAYASNKQDKLTTSNIKGSGSVSVEVGTDGVITVSGTDNDTKYTLPNASSTTLGGVKIGSNINVNSGTISVNTTATPASGSTVPLTAGGAYTALSNKQAKLSDAQLAAVNS